MGGYDYLTEELEVQVFAIGDLAIVAFGSEVFCELKKQIQQQSPFKYTLFSTLTNGGHGYIPQRESFKHGGYETCVGVASSFTEDAADILKESALKQLKELS